MERGRRYARQGQLVSFEVRPGIVLAQVQGSRRAPYVVTITVATVTDTQWAEVERTIASKLSFAAQLLAGEVPPELERVFDDVGVSLLPVRWGDLRAACSCPDDENPCKHIAAVLYVFADQLDDDPWLLLRWRGRTRDQVLRHLADAHDRPAEVAPWWPLLPARRSPSVTVPMTNGNQPIRLLRSPASARWVSMSAGSRWASCWPMLTGRSSKVREPAGPDRPAHVHTPPRPVGRRERPAHRHRGNNSRSSIASRSFSAAVTITKNGCLRVGRHARPTRRGNVLRRDCSMFAMCPRPTPKSLWIRRADMIVPNRSITTMSMLGSRSRMSSSRASMAGVSVAYAASSGLAEAPTDRIEERGKLVERLAGASGGTRRPWRAERVGDRDPLAAGEDHEPDARAGGGGSFTSAAVVSTSASIESTPIAPVRCRIQAQSAGVDGRRAGVIRCGSSPVDGVAALPDHHRLLRRDTFAARQRTVRGRPGRVGRCLRCRRPPRAPDRPRRCTRASRRRRAPRRCRS